MESHFSSMAADYCDVVDSYNVFPMMSRLTVHAFHLHLAHSTAATLKEDSTPVSSDLAERLLAQRKFRAGLPHNRWAHEFPDFVYY
jgi:hypothetical protein